MNNSKSKSPTINKIGTVKRKAVRMSEEALIKVELLSENPLPLVVKPTVEGLNLADWAINNREFIDSKLSQHGGILFRDFEVNGVTDFEHLIGSTSRDLIESVAEQNIHNEFAYAEQNIFFHNEYSDRQIFPLKIFFFCAKPAEGGGETPIANCHKIFQRLDPKIRERFLEKKWMLVRNYGSGFSSTWQKAFQTTDKAVVEKYCRNSNIEFEWKDNSRLKTCTVLPAILEHPKTAELLWFNQVAFFHISTLEPAIREALMALDEEFPNNTYYGDGSEIEASVLDEIRHCYHQETVSFTWHSKDVLMLDNLLTAHGRAPFVGKQEVFVGMSESFNNQNCCKGA
ncbi:TauD/TfdA family dioxygenase [Scytonema sp. UIC 10036]|uniref:TauD/TfdA family dioxygenase n=1 Tax=Scytonema sp. UIC 10036 TaxID=2304196 RepID=UPI0012DA6BC5|nr:TauD/TfdA family dioxygenase [Scytonema sp. UIC 10036]MUG96211.1 TauD/TfdA family dioxygenase [Scytonema sp. UIC 10036]